MDRMVHIWKEGPYVDFLQDLYKLTSGLLPEIYGPYGPYNIFGGNVVEELNIQNCVKQI